MTSIILMAIVAIVLIVAVTPFTVMVGAKMVNAKNQTFTDAFMASLLIFFFAAIQTGIFYITGLNQYEWLDLLLSLFIDGYILSKTLVASYLKGVVIFLISGFLSLIIIAILAFGLIFSGLIDMDIENLSSFTKQEEQEQQEEVQSIDLDQLDSNSELDSTD